MNQLEEAKHRLDKTLTPQNTDPIPASCSSTNIPTTEGTMGVQPIINSDVENRKLFLGYVKRVRAKTELNAEICSVLPSSTSVRDIRDVPIKRYDENLCFDQPVYQRFKNRLEIRKELRKPKRGQEFKKKSAEKKKVNLSEFCLDVVDSVLHERASQITSEQRLLL